MGLFFVGSGGILVGLLTGVFSLYLITVDGFSLLFTFSTTLIIIIAGLNHIQ